jgi:hypothetical protein
VSVKEGNLRLSFSGYHLASSFPVHNRPRSQGSVTARLVKKQSICFPPLAWNKVRECKHAPSYRREFRWHQMDLSARKMKGRTKKRRNKHGPFFFFTPKLINWEYSDVFERTLSRQILFRHHMKRNPWYLQFSSLVFSGSDSFSSSWMFCNPLKGPWSLFSFSFPSFFHPLFA